MTELSTHLQGQLVAVHPAYDLAFDGFARARGARQPRGAPASGRWSRCGSPRRPPPARADGARDLLRRAGLALALPVAAAPGGPDRDRVRRTRPALAADPRRLRRGGRGRLLRDPPRRGPVRRRHLRDVPRARRRPPALQHPLRPQPLRAAAARLPGLHRHLPPAHPRLPRQGRGVQPDRPRRASTAATALGGARRPLPLARRRAGGFRRGLLEAQRSTASPAGRCWNGSAASRTPSRARREGAPFIAAPHHQGGRTRLRRLRRPSGVDEAAEPRPCSGVAR